MTITTGTRLSHYEIIAPIGVGGMGEVYRARDSKLNRDVAIKVLPEAFARDSDRLTRFQREAQVLASLNHPNIAAIYGLEESDTIRALVMELVEGPTLDDRLSTGPIPVDEALAIARQIAEALEVAHERGIVHRDLKPANVKVTNDDKVKVLDFGLAKVLSDDSEITDLSNSPTMIKGTAAGMILGTAAYMSPEQARGRAVDKRSDIWAFGVVLMEMLTGKRLFGGETVSDVMAAVLTQQIDWTALPEVTPTPIRRLLRRCLEKDRKNRLGDATSAKLEIDDALSHASDDRILETIPPSAHFWRRRLLRIVLPAVLLIGLLVGLLVWIVQRPAQTLSHQLTLTIVPPPDIRLFPVGTMGSPPHISPDGSAVMFQSVGPRKLYVRRLDSLDFLEVPGSDTVGNESFWHGSTGITFPSAARQLFGVHLPDGAPEMVMPLNGYTRGGSWSDKGNLLVSALSHLLTRKPDGTVASISFPDKRTGDIVYPEFLPGSEDFLALFKPEDSEGEVWLATLSNGAVTNPTMLFKNDTAARYTPWNGGRVLFVKSDNLYSQRLNISSRSVEGQPELVVKGVASQPGLMRADFSVALNGTVVWRPGRAALGQVTVLDRKGKMLGSAGPPGAIESVFVSPTDDSRLLVLGEDTAVVEVGQSGRLGFPRDIQWFNWSPDGRRVLGVQGRDHLVSRQADNLGTTDQIGQLPKERLGLKVLSPDGKSILGRIESGGGGWIRVTDMVAGSWTPLVGSDESHADLSFSPDGRFVLYDAFPSSGIYVQPFPGPGHRQLIDQRGIDPVWRGDGKEILFIRDDAVWSVTVTGSADSPTFGSPEKLFDGVHRAPTAVAQSQGLAVSRDGSRIFMVQGVEQPNTNMIHVMTPAQRSQ